MAMALLMSFSYAKAQYTVTVYLNDDEWNEVTWGTVTGNEGTFANGTVVTLTVTPISGKEVKQWYNVDGDIIANNTNTCDVVVNGNTEVWVVMGNATIRHNLSVNIYPVECRNLCSVTGAGEKLDGATPTLTASSVDPFTIDHWVIDDQTVAGNADSYTLQPMHSDVTVDVYFAYIPQERTISVATNDANLGTVQIASLGEQSNTSLNIYEGQQVTLTATLVDPNAIFSGWYLGGNKVSDDLIYQFTLPYGIENRTYTANFVAPTTEFTMTAVKVGGNGGTVTPSAPVSVQAGSSNSYTFSINQIYNGWAFDGWYRDQNTTNLVTTNQQYTVTPIVENVTLYAKFHHLPYNFTANVYPTGAGTVSPASGEVTPGGSITLTATANTTDPANSYRFLNWSDNATENPHTISGINADASITANFIRTHTVTVSSTQGNAPTVSANTTPHEGRYDDGSEVTVTAANVENYVFSHWTVNGVDDLQATNAEYVITSLSSNMTLVANYAPTYRVRLFKNPTSINVTLEGAGTYRSGTTAEVRVAYDQSLYTFNGWIVYGTQNTVSTDATYQFTVTGDVDLTADFTINTVYHTVTVSVVGDGCSVTSDQLNLVNGVDNNVEENSEITLVPHAASGYRFVRWTIGGNNYPAAQYPNYSTTVTGDLNITAVFEEANIYHVTLETDPENDPIITFVGLNPGGEYNHGEALDITASANNNPNYVFLGWLKNGRLYRAARTERIQIAHVTEDMVLTAMYDVYQSEDIDYLTYDDEATKEVVTGIRDGYRASISTVNIPATVTTIADRAFANCVNLSSLIIPNSVQTMGDYVFDGCTSLTTVVLPDGLSIGTYLFNNCRSLRNVVLPADLTAIPEGLFYGCNDLSSVEIPAGVTSVGSFAFRDCRNIYTLDVPASVTTIGAQSFSNMSGLRFLNLAAGIQSIGSNCFDGSNRIVLTNFAGTLADWCAISFENANSQPMSRSRNLAINGELITELNIPNGINTIKPFAFYADTLITEIDLPSSVNTIGEKAFGRMKNLQRITLHGTSLPANVHADAFDGVSSDVIVAVPCGLENAARTAQWGGFVNFVTDGMPILTLLQRPGGTVRIDVYPSCNDAEYTYQIIANNGMNYQFQSWSDGNTEQSRTLTITEDMTLAPIWTRIENAETMTPTYSCAFENSQEKSAWFCVAPGTNKWYIGNAVHHQSVLGGSKALYVTTDENGANNEYDDDGQSTYVFSDVYMYEGINEISFYYRVTGNEGDYMSVAILPDEMNYEDLSTRSNGAIVVADNLHSDGDTWQYEARMVNVETSGWRKVAFFWNVTNNDNSTDVAAAVDNLSVIFRDPNSLQHSFVDVTVAVAQGCENMGSAYTGETPGVTTKRYYYGETITIHARPVSGYQFVRWEETGSTEADCTINFVENWGINPTLTAVFELIPTTYTVNVTLQDGTDGSSLEYGVMDANGVVNATASVDNNEDANLYLNQPQESWAFMGWANENGVIVSTENPYTYGGRVDAHFIAVMKMYHECPDYDDPTYGQYDRPNDEEPVVDHETPELRDVIVSNINVYIKDKQIVVENTGDYTVTLYDVTGRALESRVSPDHEIYFSVPLSGSYLIRVGNVMTQRVVVVK